MKFVLLLLVCVVGVNAKDTMYGPLKVLFGNAWDAVKNFLKRPRRSNRLQETVKTSKTDNNLPKYVKPTKTLPEAINKTANIQDTFNSDMLYYFQRPNHKQILLPIIPRPKWRSGDEWSENDQADNLVMRRGYNAVYKTRSKLAFSEKNVKTSKTENNLPKYVKPTKTLPEAINKTANIQDTFNPDMLYYFQGPKHKQILLPIIPRPKWRSGDEWSENDQDDNLVMRRGYKAVYKTRSKLAFSEKNVKTSKTENNLPKYVKPTKTLPEAINKTANIQDIFNPDMLYYFQRPKHKQEI